MIILAGEMLVVAEPFLTRNMHPTVIVRAYARALEVALETAERLSTRVDLSDAAQMRALIRSCIATKFSARYGDLISDLALAAVRTVTVEEGPGGAKEIDTKRYARVEKIPGGELEDCVVLSGVMMEKDVTHPKMRRRIVKPRILLLDCPLEYKKAESATNLEVRRARLPPPPFCPLPPCVPLSARLRLRACLRAPAPPVCCPADEKQICAWTDVRE